MTDQREPVDRELLDETIRLFGMAVEYKGQVFNPAKVVVHTNGVTDAHRLSLVWAVVNRWSRPDCAPTEPEATQLLGEIREALAVPQLVAEKSGWREDPDCVASGHTTGRCLRTAGDGRLHAGYLPDGTILDPQDDQ